MSVTTVENANTFDKVRLSEPETVFFCRVSTREEKYVSNGGN